MSTHVNVIPETIDSKFCVESDFTGPDAAIRRNLEDCSDSSKQIGVFRCVISRKTGAAEAGIPFIMTLQMNVTVVN